MIPMKVELDADNDSDDFRVDGGGVAANEDSSYKNDCGDYGVDGGGVAAADDVEEEEEDDDGDWTC